MHPTPGTPDARPILDPHILSCAIDNLAEGIVITDGRLDWPSPQIVFVNGAMCRITGYAASELVGQSPRLLQGPRTDRAALTQMREELAHGQASQHQLVNYRRDRTPYIADVRITPLVDASGERRYYVAIHRDVTAQRQAEEALQERDAHLSAILSTVTCAIITLDRGGQIVAANVATEQMFGYGGGELPGRNIGTLLAHAFREEVSRFLSQVTRSTDSETANHRRDVFGLRLDGTRFPADLSLSYVNSLGLFVVVMVDISERRSMQQHLLDIASDERRRIGHELHDGTGQEFTGLALLASALQNQLERISGEFPSVQVAWPVEGTTIQKLTGMASMLCQHLSECQHNIHRLSRAIMPVQRDPEGLRSALVELAQATSVGDKLVCSLQYMPGLEIADDSMATNLYRIAQEAVSNAIEHGHATTIAIEAYQIPGRLVLSISDNGIGMAAARHPSASASLKPGMGLRIMEYRAGVIGGTLQIGDGAEGGTVVKCSVSQSTGTD